MLNGDTKRKIQGARDILVGKIPVPTAQVEQITLALMYKFMSDVDEQAKKLGDKTGFFMGEYEKFSWNKITDTSLSAYDRVVLYSEGLEKMNNNPNVPQLFRDIFKGAFLPFKDPETLKLFLDQINEIEYTHSEDLGDAYEYLLSVMGSQGDAGQFRTPRHIIDFIVEIVDPKKEDKILDPACGTAGFLISAYKHILKHNTTKDSKILGDALSPMDRRNLTRNFVGYDISHEMRRLSLVNMYLHQFPDPQIYEYDTLTSTDHWDEDFDCILANPPFMTPRGGIRPHHRFAVQANRAEVLFVDYIMEHLSTSGKAGIIVPEGIIFQSSNAYKNLRKLLVEDNYLWGVVSLPGGVFQPYSGVKTSILLLDKNIAKKTDNVLFVNVENDGFDLSTNRKDNGKNDLPRILESLKKYKEWVLNDKEVKKDELFNTNIVGKSRIKESGDYNLSGNRYQSSVRGIYVKGKWKMVELGDICDIYQPKTITSRDILTEGPYKVFGANGVIGYFSEYNHEDSEVLVTCRGATCGKVNLSAPKSWITGNAMVVKPKENNLDKKFLFFLLKEGDLTSTISGSAQPQITRGPLSLYKIPLPPIEEQKKIVEELDRYQRIIDGARMVIDNWKPEIEIDPEWCKVKISEVVEETKLGVVIAKKDQNKGEIPYLKMDAIKDGYLDLGKSVYVDYQAKEQDYLIDGDFIYNTRNAPNLVGKSAVFHSKEKFLFNNNLLRIRFKKDRANVDFVNYLMNSPYGKEQLDRLISGTTSVAAIYQKAYLSIPLPLPDIETQNHIAKSINDEKEQVLSSKKFINLYEEKQREYIKRVLMGHE